MKRRSFLSRALALLAAVGLWRRGRPGLVVQPLDHTALTITAEDFHRLWNDLAQPARRLSDFYIVTNSGAQPTVQRGPGA